MGQRTPAADVDDQTVLTRSAQTGFAKQSPMSLNLFGRSNHCDRCVSHRAADFGQALFGNPKNVEIVITAVSLDADQ